MGVRVSGKIEQIWAKRQTTGLSLTNVAHRLVRKLLVRRTQPRGQRANRVDLLIGESGIGKTATVRTLVERLTAGSTELPWKLKLWHVATQGFEDVTGLPIIEKKKGQPAVAKFAKADHVPGAVHDPEHYTLGVFDELPTAPPLIQNQIREMIDGQLNGEPIDPNCLYLATGNPPESKFVTVQAMDDALEKRLKVYAIVPTDDELLTVWSTLLPKRIHSFLLMNPKFIDAVSPREWEGIAKDVEDTLAGGGSIDDAIAEAAADLYSSMTVVTKMREYFKFGDDPYHYPITGRSVITATKKEHDTQLTLLKKWAKDRVDGRIGATAHDLMRVLTMLTSDFKEQARAAENVVGITTVLIDAAYIDLGKSVLATVMKSPLRGKAGKLFEDTEQYDKLVTSIDGINELKQAVGAANTDRP